MIGGGVERDAYELCAGDEATGGSGGGMLGNETRGATGGVDGF